MTLTGEGLVLDNASMDGVAATSPGELFAADVVHHAIRASV
jgi:hypothetical protein